MGFYSNDRFTAKFFWPLEFILPGAVYYDILFRVRDQHFTATELGPTDANPGAGLASGAQWTRSCWHRSDGFRKDAVGQYQLVFSILLQCALHMTCITGIYGGLY